VAALGVAAHETGHALQHKNAYAPLAFRNAFVPVATVTTNLAFPLFLIGFIIGGTVKWLMDVGILFFVGALVFHLVTLPVEFNASARAISVLEGRGYLQGTEVQGARKVLNAAAWTYVAAATMALSQLLRLLLLRSSRD
jgi:Zn-dependent membrane protease YugP